MKPDLDLGWEDWGEHTQQGGDGLTAAVASARIFGGTLKQWHGQEGVAEGMAGCGGGDPHERATRGLLFCLSRSASILYCMHM